MPINYTPPTLVAGTNHETDAGGSTKLNVAFFQAFLNALKAAADSADANEAALAGKASVAHGHSIGDVSGLQTALDGKQPTGSYSTTGHTHTAANITDFNAAADARIAPTRGAYVGINAQTGTAYTPVLADQGKLVTINNAGAITLTLPQDSALAFPVGASFDIAQFGAGAITIVAGSGATKIPSGATVTRAQGSGATCTKVAPNTWWVVGDLA